MSLRDNLFYKVSSRTDRAIQRNKDSKKPKPKEKVRTRAKLSDSTFKFEGWVLGSAQHWKKNNKWRAIEKDILVNL